MLFPEIDPEKMKECKYCPTLFLSLYCWHACKHCMLGFQWKVGKCIEPQQESCQPLDFQLTAKTLRNFQMSIRKSSVTVQLELRKESHTDSVEFSLHLVSLGSLNFKWWKFSAFSPCLLNLSPLQFKPKKTCCNHSYLILVIWLEHPPLTPTPSHQPHSTPPTHPLILLFCDFHFHL